ncbi:MAG TPA: hypothetical protein VJQ08_04735 [Candidatus Dormibacteraeota bacterium]|nr:hypothetical protein [Candidatus Dormibacteraeota bacterium]
MRALTFGAHAVERGGVLSHLAEDGGPPQCDAEKNQPDGGNAGVE